tara:strand:+ start:341 stop:493 length:153 start_codon:yes stop_codon:yes gene_type:complete
MTAYQALFWIGGLSTIKELNADQKVLIHAGASGYVSYVIVKLVLETKLII